MKKSTILSKRAGGVILCLSLSLLPSAALGQGEWQWAKSYTGQDAYGGTANNEIVSADFDADGNIYVLGKFGHGAAIDGEKILPDSIVDSMAAALRPLGLPFEQDRRGTVIAKFTPPGRTVLEESDPDGGVGHPALPAAGQGRQDSFPRNRLLWNDHVLSGHPRPGA